MRTYLNSYLFVGRDGGQKTRKALYVAEVICWGLAAVVAAQAKAVVFGDHVVAAGGAQR